MKNATIRKLEPQQLWGNFADLNAIPRASKKEEEIAAFVRHFGERLGLETYQDPTGNVIIRKEATPGMENHRPVILQAHLDMVHQKNADVEFDFATEGIRTYVDGEWVKAEGTTLGADNGIGAAAIMTILESTDIPHPPLEALFTIDEETGMSGAKGLEEGRLDGKILLNLDSEEDDELTIGCAGGLDSYTRMNYQEDPLPSGYTGLKVMVRGLKGGHSGIDIHKGRANANKILVRLLYHTDQWKVRLAEIDGGGLRNAIPREAVAVIALPADEKQAFASEFQERSEAIRAEFRTIEPNMAMELTDCPPPDRVVSAGDQRKILSALYAVPNGVFRMSPEIPDLVETSSNLARVTLKDGAFITQSLQRSSVESGKTDIANAVRAAFEAIGATVTNDGDYPGWAPDAQSAILSQMKGIYEKLFDGEPKVAACHAGLECGIIGQHYPGLDMISFGPTIRHAHSPDEMVNIASVQKFWQYLLATLKAIPENGIKK